MPGDLEKLGLERFDDEVFAMSYRELRDRFSYKNGELHTTRLIRNLIWDDWHRLEDGRLDPIEGNVRTYWYERVKPVLSRARARKYADKYDSMTAQFVSLIVDHKLMEYRDFGLVDQNKPWRRLGSDNDRVWVVAEKTGQMALLEEIYERYGVTIMALGGSPSALSSETFIGELEAAGHNEGEILMLTLVDYDPSGDNIARSFMWQLNQLGLKAELRRVDIVHPDHMTEEQIRLNKYSLSRSRRQKGKNTRWIHRTGGLDGKPKGLQADAMTWPQVFEVFEREAAPHLSTPPGDIRRKRLKRELAEVLKGVLLRRLLG